MAATIDMPFTPTSLIYIINPRPGSTPPIPNGHWLTFVSPGSRFLCADTALSCTEFCFSDFLFDIVMPALLELSSPRLPMSYTALSLFSVFVALPLCSRVLLCSLSLISHAVLFSTLHLSLSSPSLFSKGLDIYIVRILSLPEIHL